MGVSSLILDVWHRFPTGAIIGHHLVIAGTYLANADSVFAIWALDISAQPRGGKLNWQKVLTIALNRTVIDVKIG